MWTSGQEHWSLGSPPLPGCPEDWMNNIKIMDVLKIWCKQKGCHSIGLVINVKNYHHHCHNHRHHHHDNHLGGLAEPPGKGAKRRPMPQLWDASHAAWDAWCRKSLNWYFKKTFLDGPGKKCEALFALWAWTEVDGPMEDHMLAAFYPQDFILI